VRSCDPGENTQFGMILSSGQGDQKQDQIEGWPRTAKRANEQGRLGGISAFLPPGRGYCGGAILIDEPVSQRHPKVLGCGLPSWGGAYRMRSLKVLLGRQRQSGSGPRARPTCNAHKRQESGRGRRGPGSLLGLISNGFRRYDGIRLFGAGSLSVRKERGTPSEGQTDRLKETR